MRLGFILLILTFLLANNTNLFAAGLPPEQVKLFNQYIHYYDIESCASSDAGDEAEGEIDLESSAENAKNVFMYFTSKGYSEEQAAGIIGNMVKESGVEPQRQQSIFDRLVPANKFPDPEGGTGWGIVQWTHGSKMIDPVKAEGKDPNELIVQLDFLWNQLEGKGPIPEGDAGKQLKATTTVEEAVLAFQGNTKVGGKYIGFERPADQAGTVPQRTASAKAVLKKFSGLTGTVSKSSSTGDCKCSTTDSGSKNIDGVLKKLAEENGGQTSLSVQSVSGNISSSANGNLQMPTRSSYKIYTAYATLRAIEEGKISWGTSIWGGQSVEATMEAMIVQSNNDAAEALRTNPKIGTPPRVTAMLQNDLGLSDKTVMGSGDATDATGSNSKSTANDFAKFLVKLEKHELKGVAKDASYNKLLSFMKRATTDGGSSRDGIASGVGSGVEVADKPGWAPGPADPASNDVGIVYLKEKPYAVAILTDKPSKWDGVKKIAEGIHEAMGSASDAGTGGCGSDGAVSGDLSATVKNYAHPEYHPAPFIEPKKAYESAFKKASSEGIYIGGKSHPGIDCGGFITLAMINSGYEPNYNYSGKLSKEAGPTLIQETWLKENWQQINPRSTADLKSGDVAITSKHTYMYVGKIEGFGSNIASASLDSRAPMAGEETPADPSFSWYRKK